MTHADSKAKTTLDFIWQAPVDYQGDVLFRSTFVKDYSTFWVAVPSSNGLVRVGRGAGSAGPGQFPSSTYSPFGAAVTTAPTRYPGSNYNNHNNNNQQQSQTNSWAFPTAQAPASASSAAALLPAIYTGCGDTKGCFGLPDPSCVKSGTCSALVTFALKGMRYEFELWADNVKQNTYVAVGFSSDNKMVRLVDLFSLSYYFILMISHLLCCCC